MADLPKVNRIQSEYKAKPLSSFLKQPAPPAAPAVNWPQPANIMTPGPGIFPIVDFLFNSARPIPRRALYFRASPKSMSALIRPST